MRSFFFAAAVSFVALPACTTYRDDLARSQRAFEDNQHEAALAILRMLEPDTLHLNEDERARYAYIRGMTDFRIGFRADARHWLCVAKAMDDKQPGEIPPQWRARLDQSLAELDAQVFASGFDALPIAPETSAKRPTLRKHRVKTEEPADRSSDEEEEQQPAKQAPKKKPPVEDEDE